MTETLTLPRLGETMESGRVAGWLKQPGESFRRGETIVEIESDKTVVELPALGAGRLLEILAPAGAEIAVGAALCRYEGEPASGVSEPPPPEQAALASEAVPSQPEPAVDSARLRATPVARRLAREHQVDLAGVPPTGRRGRIEARDVHDATSVSDPGAAQLASRIWGAKDAPRGTAVLLHGLAGDSQTWAGLAAALVRLGFAVVAVDLPAHGATTLGAADLPDLVAATTDFLLHRGDPRPVELVGHSLGAAVAALVARAIPDRVARLTLLAPAGMDSEIDADFIAGIVRARTPGGLNHLLRRLVLRPPVLSTVQLDAMVAALGPADRLLRLADSLVADGRQQIDIVPELEALDLPTRIVWGLQDRIIPWTQVSHAPSRVALHLIADCGHVPHWDQPHQVAALFA